MTREEKLEIVVKLFSKCMFYGDWKWESPNERVIQMLMEELNYYPHKDEDEMISKTFVDDKLYIQARDKVQTRKPNDNDGIQQEKGTTRIGF